MEHSQNEHRRGPFKGQRWRNRVNGNRNRVRNRNDRSEHSSSQERRVEGPSIHRRRILRQMHASDRNDRREHIPSSRRRKRLPMKYTDFRARNRRDGAFSPGRNRKKASEGRSLNRRDQNVGRRFRWMPAADVCESDDNIIISVELPGVSEEDINVTVVENRLTIKGVKKSDRSDDNIKVRRSSRQFGRFRHAFPLPRHTEASEIKADFKDGILSVSVPKPETSKPTQIPINPEQ